MQDPDGVSVPEVAYDLRLFEALNAEYEGRPLVPRPPPQHDRGRRWSARRRARIYSEWVDLADKRVLEIGAGTGHLSRALARRTGARGVIGVDVVSRPEWERLSSRRVSFHRVDLTRDELLPERSVDVIVSNAVLEHVRRPLAMIEVIARLLRVGGEAVLNFNLHAGPKASHRYREVYFPWPHLLFGDDVCRLFYERHHGGPRSFAWVNRLTAAQYAAAFSEAGLQVERLERRTTPIDIPLYTRFEDRLGRYAALDLETDFLVVKLKKRRRGSARPATLDYSRCQRQFETELEAYRAMGAAMRPVPRPVGAPRGS